MNKIERLTGIILMLNRKSKVQARELAELFEVSERTIYRDVQALAQLQVPIIAETGVSGGYRIASEYFLQPIVLTASECQALFLGGEFIRSQQGFPLAKPAALALAKLTTLIPDTILSAAQNLAAKISYNVPVAAASIQLSQILDAIKHAMEERQTVEIGYQALHSPEITQRKVDIYRLFFEQDAWHIMGYCHLRHEVRQFKVVRIRTLQPTTETFTVEQWETSAVDPNAKPDPYLVRIRKASPTGKKLKEGSSYQSFICREDEQSIDLSFPAAWFSTSYIIQLVLGFGKDAELISPPEIRDAMLETLETMIKSYH